MGGLTLYLHVGPHKTGSTYVQELCTGKSEVMAAAGLLYPKEYFRLYGHHDICKVFNSHDDEVVFHSVVDKWKKQGCDILLSSEKLSLMSGDFFRKLKGLFPEYAFKIIYYYRSPSDRMVSQWQELVKHGFTSSFPEFFAKSFFRVSQKGDIGHERFLTDLESVVGRENMVFIDHKRCVSEGNSMQALMSVVGLNGLVEDDNVRRNLSLPIAKAELFRALNIAQQRSDCDASENVRLAFNRLRLAKEPAVRELMDMISADLMYIEVGNSAVDLASYDYMVSRYSDRFWLEPLVPVGRKVKVPRGEWMFNPRALQLLYKVFSVSQGQSEVVFQD
ncbi:hypothetical protein ACQUQU_09705 [Thalassolituus sp. LLYu03]|uniref:hypothetical protein n=1 Tax=Thalassolituus sp. LLYu03 TaxID=3421656 RepID=UPI003D2A732F